MKNVVEGVDVSLLRESLAKFGAIKTFEPVKTRVCVVFSTINRRRIANLFSELCFRRI